MECNKMNWVRNRKGNTIYVIRWWKELQVTKRSNSQTCQKKSTKRKQLLWQYTTNVNRRTIWQGEFLSWITDLEDLQQIHLANDASSHPLVKLQLETQQARAEQWYKALQHGPYGQMPGFSLTSTMRENSNQKDPTTSITNSNEVFCEHRDQLKNIYDKCTSSCIPLFMDLNANKKEERKPRRTNILV